MRKPDDWGAGLVDDFFGRLPLLFRFGEIDGRVGKFLQHRVGALILHLAVVPIDRFEDVFPRGEGDFHRPIENKPQFVERVQIVGIAHDYPQGAVIEFGHRQDSILAGDRFGYQFDDRRRNRHLVQVDKIERSLLATARMTSSPEA